MTDCHGASSGAVDVPNCLTSLAKPSVTCILGTGIPTDPTDLQAMESQGASEEGKTANAGSKRSAPDTSLAGPGSASSRLSDGHAAKVRKVGEAGDKQVSPYNSSDALSV